MYQILWFSNINNFSRANFVPVISYKYKNLRIPVYKSKVYFCNLEDIKKLFMTRVVDTLNVTKTSIYPPNLERELLYLDISRGARYGFKGTVQEIWI